MRSQKDTDARWTKKNGKNFFGYKNHISADVKYKLIRRYSVSSAEVHDSIVFEELLDTKNTSAESGQILPIARKRRSFASKDGLRGAYSAEGFSFQETHRLGVARQ